MRKLTKKQALLNTSADVAADNTPASEPVAADNAIVKPAPIPLAVLKRDATVNGMQYPFRGPTARDDSYIVYAAYLMRTLNRDCVTVADLLGASVPHFDGSNKRRNPFTPHAFPSAPPADSGAIERNIKRGYLHKTVNADGINEYRFTDTALTSKPYTFGHAAETASPIPYQPA